MCQMIRTKLGTYEFKANFGVIDSRVATGLRRGCLQVVRQNLEWVFLPEYLLPNL